MKTKLIFIVVILYMLLTLTACSSINIYSEHREPDDFVMIQTIGIDWIDDKVRVTACTGTGLDGEKPKIFTDQGSTLSEAINNIKYAYIKGEAFFSHTSHILIGEEAARHGLGEYLDYAARNINMRLSSNLYIVKGGNAEYIIKGAADENNSAKDMLTAIEEKSEFMMLGKISTCESTIEELAEHGYTLISAVKSEESEETEEKIIKIVPDGCALIQDGEAREFISEKVTSGVGLIKEEIKSGEISIKTKEGAPVTLKLMELSTNIKAEYVENGINNILIDLSAEFNVEGAVSTVDLSKAYIRAEIEEIAAAELHTRVEAAIKTAQSVKTDFCGLGEKLSISNPYKFRSAYEEWKSGFPNVAVKIQVKAILERTYDVINTPDLRGESKCV